jgi:hypothetical protein
MRYWRVFEGATGAWRDFIDRSWACFALDTIPQIRLFVKLKLQKCAPIPGLPGIGFFIGAQAG